MHGEGNGNPLQCSCLENPRDGGAWWAALSGVAQSRTRLKRLSSSSSQYSCLENPMDGGAWWAAVRGVLKSRTRLSDFIFTFMHGEGNGNPLQCFCLENPRDGGAWWAAVYGIAHSRTRLKRLTSSSVSATLFFFLSIFYITHTFKFFPTVYYFFFELLFPKTFFQPERLLLVFILDKVCRNKFPQFCFCGNGCYFSFIL